MSISKNLLPTNRNFGITIGSILLLICYFFYSLPILLLGSLLIILGSINSSILNYPNRIWFKFGLYISKIFNPVILGIIFFLLFVPIGILLKILNKDIMGLKIDKSLKTFWASTNETKNYNEMKDQF